MRFLKVAGFLFAISVVWSIAIRAISGSSFLGVASIGEISGTAIGLFLVAMVGSIFGLIGPKARSTPVLTPVVTGGLAATGWAALSIVGMFASQQVSDQNRGSKPPTHATVQSRYTKHIDKANRFAVTYDPTFEQMEPNEEVTRMLIFSRPCQGSLNARPLGGMVLATGHRARADLNRGGMIDERALELKHLDNRPILPRYGLPLLTPLIDPSFSRFPRQTIVASFVYTACLADELDCLNLLADEVGRAGGISSDCTLR